MRHHTDTRRRSARASAPSAASPSSSDRPSLRARLLRRLAQGAVVGAAGFAAMHALSSEPQPQSEAVIAAEAGTRDLLDDRAAAHLRRLRDL